MLAFVTSIRHPDNSDDYSRVEALLKDTLDSVTNQTSDEFVVIVVGNRPPAFELPTNVRFVTVSFDAPRAENGPHASREPFVLDKGSKIGIGLVAARNNSPDQVMIFDADDFVHRDLVKHCSGSSARDTVHVIEKGWMYSARARGYQRQDGFNRTCGTSYIVPYNVYGVPDALTETASQAEVVEAFGDRLWNIMGAHREATSWFRDSGVRVTRLPFRGAVYQVDTGENHSGKTMRGIARPAGKAFRARYGLPPRGVGLRTVLRCIGPGPIAESATRLGRRVWVRLRRSQ